MIITAREILKFEKNYHLREKLHCSFLDFLKVSSIRYIRDNHYLFS